MYTVEILVCAGAVAFFADRFYRFSRDSEQFRVRRVEITGLQRMQEEEILKSAGIPATANVLHLDPESTVRRVERLPYVETCDVTTEFPDTIVISIKEREPLASLIVRNRAYELDRDAHVLRRYERAEMPMEPFITFAAELAPYEPGDKLESPAVHAALEVWEAFSSIPLANVLTVSEIHVEREDTVRMFANEVPFQIIWGRVDANTQSRRLSALWDAVDLAGLHTEYVDLRFGRDIVCK